MEYVLLDNPNNHPAYGFLQFYCLLNKRNGYPLDLYLLDIDH